MKNKIYKIILVFVGLAMGLFLAEGLFRTMLLFFREPSSYEVEIGKMYKYNPDLGWDLIPNSQSEYKSIEYDINYKINENGFRDDKDYKISKNNKRIVVLGDSFTFGIGVNNNETFSKIIEEKTDCEVLNLGVSGYAPSQYLLGFRTKGSRYNPDMVIVAIHTGNDLYDTGLRYKTTGIRRYKPYFDFEAKEGKLALVLRGVPVPEGENSILDVADNRIKNHKLYSYTKWFWNWETFNLVKRFMKRDGLYNILEKAGLANSADDFNYELDIIGLILSDMKKDLAKLGPDKKLIVLIIPSRDAEHDHLQKTLINRLTLTLEEEKVPYINLLPNITKDLYYKYDGHFKADGHKIAAKELYKTINPLIDCSKH